MSDSFVLAIKLSMRASYRHRRRGTLPHSTVLHLGEHENSIKRNLVWVVTTSALRPEPHDLLFLHAFDIGQSTRLPVELLSRLFLTLFEVPEAIGLKGLFDISTHSYTQARTSDLYESSHQHLDIHLIPYCSAFNFHIIRW